MPRTCNRIACTNKILYYHIISYLARLGSITIYRLACAPCEGIREPGSTRQQMLV